MPTDPAMPAKGRYVGFAEGIHPLPPHLKHVPPPSIRVPGHGATVLRLRLVIGFTLNRWGLRMQVGVCPAVCQPCETSG